MAFLIKCFSWTHTECKYWQNRANMAELQILNLNLRPENELKSIFFIKSVPTYISFIWKLFHLSRYPPHICKYGSKYEIIIFCELALQFFKKRALLNKFGYIFSYHQEMALLIIFESIEAALRRERAHVKLSMKQQQYIFSYFELSISSEHWPASLKFFHILLMACG